MQSRNWSKSFIQEKFRAAWPKVVNSICDFKSHGSISVSKNWLEKVLKHNVPHGKGFRGMSAVLSYWYMSKDITEDDLELACILGWVLEIIQASFLVADDIIDSSQTRRGQPCWYKLDNVGLSAVNDAFMLESAAYFLLRKHFRNKEYYSDLVSIIQDVIFKTTLGQNLDTQSSNDCDFKEFTMDRYTSICKYKTSYYSFYLPIFGAMMMTGKRYTTQQLLEVETILLDIGLFFQIQDDFLDAFGDSTITGKVGTDIVEGKCSWLIVTALDKASPAEQRLLKKLYKQGKEEADQVKEIYRNIKLLDEYSIIEEKLCLQIQVGIDSLGPEILMICLNIC